MINETPNPKKQGEGEEKKMRERNVEKRRGPWLKPAQSQG
jgi:hypothetical protein